MSIMGFRALEPYITMLPCPTQQALFQLREKLKREMLKHNVELKKFELRFIEIDGKVFFPFQGEDYWLATKIHDKTERIEVLTIISKKELKKKYPNIEALIKKLNT